MNELERKNIPTNILFDRELVPTAKITPLFRNKNFLGVKVSDSNRCHDKNGHSDEKDTVSSNQFRRSSNINSTDQVCDLVSSINIPLAFSADVLAKSKMKLLPDMTPDQSLDVNVSIGLRDFTGEQYKSSLKRLNKAIIHHPNDITPRFVRGLCLEKLCQYDLALKDFSVCCQLGMQYENRYECALAYFNRGVISNCMQNFKGAMEHFTKAISLYDLDPDFYGNRALLYRRSGDFQNAQKDYHSMRNLSSYDECHLNQHKHHKYIPSNNQSQCRTGKINCADDKSGSDLKSSFYGQVYTAISCPAKDRTPNQLDILVKETKMMTAFVHFDIDQLRTLWKYLEYQKYPTNSRIFEQGDPADDYFVIWTGCVSARVRKESSTIRHANVARAFALETEFVVNTMKAGETLGEAVLQGGTRKAACVTEETTELLVLRKIHFDLTFRLFLERVHDDKVNFLSKFQCFRNFDKKKLNTMADFIREHEYNTGDTIIRQNEIADSVYFIKSGLISISRIPDTEGSEHIEPICLSKLCSGDIFGEAAANGNPCLRKLFPSTAVSETKAICYRLDKKQMDRCGWDQSTRTLLSIMAIKYPDDTILVQAYVDRKRRLQIRKKMQKELRRKK